MVRIVVDHDIIGAPQPIVAQREIEGCDAEEEPAEPEASRTATPEPEDMASTDPSWEMAVLEWMIEVKVAVVTTHPMANPVAVRVDVRAIRMAIPVVEIRVVSARFRPAVKDARTSARDVSATAHVPASTGTAAASRVPTAARMTAATSAALRKRRHHTHRCHQEQSHERFHLFHRRLHEKPFST